MIDISALGARLRAKVLLVAGECRRQISQPSAAAQR